MTSQVWVEDAACAAEEDGASFDKSLCEGRRLRGLNLILARTYDEAVSSLQSKSDRDARGVLQNLSSDLKKQNNALSAYMAQLWDMNSGLREMLKKSEDGQAAIHMHKAAELLVKGLANAEEEVLALKATLKEVVGQRDSYRDRLAKTNAELDSTHAFVQVSMSSPPKMAATFAVQTPTESTAASPTPSVKRRGKGKGRNRSDGMTAKSTTTGAQPANVSGTSAGGALEVARVVVPGVTRISRPGTKGWSATATTGAANRYTDSRAVGRTTGIVRDLGGDAQTTGSVRDSARRDITKIGGESCFNSSANVGVTRSCRQNAMDAGRVARGTEETVAIDGGLDAQSRYDSDDAPSMFF